MKMANMTDLAVIVSSRVKAEIFRLLFGLRRPELHLREIVRQSGLSLGTVQQELKGLPAVGLLKLFVPTTLSSRSMAITRGRPS
jgi:predicted transcriptional regulator